MKTYLRAVWAAVLFLLGGCTYPMMIQHGGQKQVAPKLGVEEEKIRFLRNVVYSMNPVDYRSKRSKGILALTDDQVVFLRGSLQDSTVDSIVPIADIDGLHIGKGNKEVQFKLGEERIAVWVISEGDQKHRDIPSKLLYRLLLAEGVTPWESDKSYSRINSRSQRTWMPNDMGSRGYNDNPPTAGDRAWAQSNPGYPVNPR